MTGASIILASFQSRVGAWIKKCFVTPVTKSGRNHRFLEEALELVQSLGCTREEAHDVVDYVFGRPVGVPALEVGGVMTTLAALCLVNGLDMDAAAEAELERVNRPEVIEKIRRKEASKPDFSALPGRDDRDEVELQRLQEIADGAWGDGPFTRGAARDALVKAQS